LSRSVLLWSRDLIRPDISVEKPVADDDAMSCAPPRRAPERYESSTGEVRMAGQQVCSIGIGATQALSAAGDPLERLASGSTSCSEPLSRPANRPDLSGHIQFFEMGSSANAARAR
jgi:hypothetical protein